MNKTDFLEKIKTYGTLIHDKHINTNELVTDIKNFTNIEKLDIILQFCSEFENIYFSRVETSSKDLLSIVISPSAAPVELKKFTGNDDIIRVAYIHNASGSIKDIFMRQDGIFVDKDGVKIAESIDDFLQYLLTVEFDYHASLKDSFFDILRLAGWYEGRNIDISKIEEKFEMDGTPISDEQKAFLREFGGIKGVSVNNESFEIYDSVRMPNCIVDNIKYHKRKQPTSDDLYSYSPINLVAYKNEIDMLSIGEIGNGIIPLWISTDGKLYVDQGIQIGRTILEGLQTILLS